MSLFSSALSVTMLLTSVASAMSPASATLDQVRAQLAIVSIPFMENAGQFDARVKFSAPTFAGTLFVTADGELIYALPGKAESNENDSAVVPGRATRRAAQSTTNTVLTETFVGGRPKPTASVPHATNVSRFIGDDPARHQPHIRTFEHVALGEVFPGIDVRLRATVSNVEKIFTVGPRKIQRGFRWRLAAPSGLPWVATDA